MFVGKKKPSVWQNGFWSEFIKPRRAYNMMDSKILDVMEEAFAGELELLSDLGSLEAVIAAKLRTLGGGSVVHTPAISGL